MEKFEKNEEGIDYDEEAMVEIHMELENGIVILEDKGFIEVSIIKIPLDKNYDGIVQDTLMSHVDGIHDDAPYIKESVTHTSTWSGKSLPLEIDDDPP